MMQITSTADGAFPVGLLRMMQITSTADGAILRRLRRDARITMARERRVGRVNGSVIGAFTLQDGLDATVTITLTIWTYTHFTSSRTRNCRLLLVNFRSFLHEIVKECEIVGISSVLLGWFPHVSRFAAVNVLSDAFLSRRAVKLILIFVAMYNGSGHIYAISLTNDSAGRVVGMTKVRLVDARSESGATKFDGVKIVMVVVIIVMVVLVGAKDARNHQKYDGEDDKTRHLRG